MDYDVALIGTGLAPLVAAQTLMNRGLRPLILNPDWDFFREDSELPLDPLVGQVPLSQVQRSEAEKALQILSPYFPGAIEAAGFGAKNKTGFRDQMAPHLRARSRIWLRSDRGESDFERAKQWECIENLFVESADAGLHPQEFEGLSALSRFPGYSGNKDRACRAILIPRLYDIDGARYRNGILEFVRDRLGPAAVQSAVQQIELTSEGVRFYAGRTSRQIKIKNGVLIYWTPRMNQWIRTHTESRDEKSGRDFKKIEPMGTRVFEEWTLISREPLDPANIGVYEDLVAWSQFEGDISQSGTLLSVLRVGRRQNQEAYFTDSFDRLARLCHELLNWDKFSVRSMRPRLIYDWENSLKVQNIKHKLLDSAVVGGVDGALLDVVMQASQSVERFL